MAAPREVIDLVDRLHQHRDEYARIAYKEAQVCAEFIMPMFEALGWDVYNRRGYAEANKEHASDYEVQGCRKVDEES